MTEPKHIPMNSDEHDALTRWRHYERWKSGERKAIKRGYNRRWRRKTRVQLSQEE